MSSTTGDGARAKTLTKKAGTAVVVLAAGFVAALVLTRTPARLDRIQVLQLPAVSAPRPKHVANNTTSGMLRVEAPAVAHSAHYAAACRLISRQKLQDGFQELLHTPELQAAASGKPIGHGTCNEAFVGTVCSGTKFLVTKRYRGAPVRCATSHAAHQAFLLQRVAPVLEARPGSVPELYAFDADTDALYQSVVKGKPLSNFPTQQRQNATAVTQLAISALLLVELVRQTGVTHADITPENVLFTWDNFIPSMALIDFAGTATPQRCAAQEKAMRQQWNDTFATATGKHMSALFNMASSNQHGPQEMLYFWQGPCPNDVTAMALSLASVACPKRPSPKRNRVGYCTPQTLRSARPTSVLGVLAKVLSPDFPSRLQNVHEIVAQLAATKSVT